MAELLLLERDDRTWDKLIFFSKVVPVCAATCATVGPCAALAVPRYDRLRAAVRDSPAVGCPQALFCLFLAHYMWRQLRLLWELEWAYFKVTPPPPPCCRVPPPPPHTHTGNAGLARRLAVAASCDACAPVAAAAHAASASDRRSRALCGASARRIVVRVVTRRHSVAA